MEEPNVELTPKVRERLLEFQRTEITEYALYKKLAGQVEGENRRVMEKIAADELAHYNLWRNYTGQDVAPDQGAVRKYYWLSRIFGFTFGVKMMENGEEEAQEGYEELRGVVPEIDRVIEEEDRHEHELLDMLDEERLAYASSVVLGLNDALVELTGALAGFTLALQNARLIAIIGLITGMAAALSMAASEYLSTKAESEEKDPVRASLYTGGAYLGTVAVLIFPFLLLSNYYISLAITMILAVAIIAVFNYYISVAKNLDFKRQFLEMTFISLGVAGFSFLVGYVLRAFFGVEA
jgi:VIT1/CCC1 family predicted Fe2+/Mn2+ transporter